MKLSEKLSSISIISIPIPYLCRRILLELIGFFLFLLPSFLTSCLTDTMIGQYKNIPYVWIAGVVFFVFLIHLYRFYFVNYRAQVFANSLASDFTSALAKKAASCRMPEYEAQSKSKLYNMFSSDISSVYTMGNYLVYVPANIIKVITVLVILFHVHFGVGITAVVLAPFYILSSYLNKSRLVELVREEREAADLLVQDIQVMINGKVSIGLNRAFPWLLNHFEQDQDSFYRARNRQHFYLKITMELPSLITTAAPLLILIIGGNLVVGGQMTLGTLLLSIQLVNQVFTPLAEIASIHADMMSQQHIFRRDKEFMALPDQETSDQETSGRELSDREGKKIPAGEALSGAPALCLKNADLLRPDGTHLFHVDTFLAPQTGLVLIKGENGCGKSSLFHLLSGVFSPDQLSLSAEGSYWFAPSCRESLSYLFYPSFMFPGTVEDNILYGRLVPRQEFERIHTLLQLPPADKQVCIKPENLSLGEKQKICLARLLLGQYHCLLLDEPGSNLDELTEASLIEELARRKESQLLLVISHNDHYDAIADSIYLINDGQMRRTVPGER